MSPSRTDRVLMLDLDGTLIDTSPLFFEGVPPIISRHLGLPVERDVLLSMWGQLARNIFVYYAQRTGAHDPGLVDRMYAEFEQYYNHYHNDLCKTYDHVTECLPRLKKHLRAVGVVTTRPTSRSAMIYRLPWSKHLDFIIWGDQVPNVKPAPDGLNLAMQRHGSGPEAAGIYVGDNPHDIQAAKASRYRVTSVAGLWGAFNHDALMAALPDQAFETFEDLSDWILNTPD